MRGGGGVGLVVRWFVGWFVGSVNQTTNSPSHLHQGTNPARRDASPYQGEGVRGEEVVVVLRQHPFRVHEERQYPHIRYAVLIGPQARGT